MGRSLRLLGLATDLLDARVLKQFVFKLAGAFGIIESDEVRYLDETHLRTTQ